MPFIKVIEPKAATGETKEAYRYMRQVGGGPLVANVVKLFSLRPDTMRRMVRSWELAMWMGDEPRSMRELMAASISRYNDCHY